MKETIKYLWNEAKNKRNGKESSVVWYLGEGTSGIYYYYTDKDNVTCYIYINRNGKYSRPKFSLITKRFPYGTGELCYSEALLYAD